MCKSEENYINGLVKDMRIVAHARFNKIRRLKRNNFLAMFSISTASIAMIVLSLAEKVYDLKLVDIIPFLNFSIEIWFFNIISAIIILAISIAISTLKLEVELEKLNESAVSLNEIQRKLDFNIKYGSTFYNNRDLFEEYLIVIKSNLTNHDIVDYKIARRNVNKAKEFFSYFLNHLYEKKTALLYIIIIFLYCYSIFDVIRQVA